MSPRQSERLFAIRQFLKRRIVSENVELRVAQALIFVGADLMVGYAFVKMAGLQLTEAQWLLGLAIVIALALQCVMLAALIDLRRKGVGPASPGNAGSPSR